ncbi:uncharacterized protein ACO6RY_14155 [Pungitius sinensis]
MIVFRVFTHRSGLKPIVNVLHFGSAYKELKPKIEELRLKGCHPLQAGLFASPPSNHKKKGQRSLARMPQETLFSNLVERNGGGVSLAQNKIKISSQSEKLCTF